MTKTKDKLKIDGILLLNKPYGFSSNFALQQVKRLYKAQKAGHSGSLDPIATGMLPICFGEGTKLCQYLLSADKCYEVTGLLGIKTTTADAMGEIIAQSETFTVLEIALQAVLSRFIGRLKQVPSMFSALKHQGRPLYKYARVGIDIPRPSRDIIIHDLKLTHFDGKYFSLNIVCSKGTYIRNIVEDIGEALGVGAHVTKLHRKYTAGFDLESMFELEHLYSASIDQLQSYLLPIERAVDYLPKLILNADEVCALRQGKTLVSLEAGSSSCIRLYDTDNSTFIGLGELCAGVLQVKRLLAY